MNLWKVKAKLKEKIRIRNKNVEELQRQKHTAEGYLERLREELEELEGDSKGLPEGAACHKQ